MPCTKPMILLYLGNALDATDPPFKQSVQRFKPPTDNLNLKNRLL